MFHHEIKTQNEVFGRQFIPGGIRALGDSKMTQHFTRDFLAENGYDRGEEGCYLVPRNPDKLIHHLAFDSVQDHLSDAVKVDNEYRHNNEKRLVTEAAWFGKSFANYGEVERALQSHQSKEVDQVEAMIADLRRMLPPPTEIARKRRWSEDDGDEFCYDRFVKRQPFFRAFQKTPVVSCKLVSLFVQNGAPWHYTPEMMMWRGAAVAAVASLLDEAGYQTEVFVCNYTRDAFGDDDGAHNCANLFQSLCLKRSEDTLSVNDVIVATSSWFRRSIGLVAYYLAAPNVIPGHGITVKPTENIFDLVASNGSHKMMIDDAFDRNAVVALATQKLQSLSTSSQEVFT
jgi:hypothetical protein